MATFDICNTPPTETIRLISTYINRITAANDRLPPTRTGLTRFHARTIPTIDVQGYLNRILKYAPCGNECFLAVLIYLDRMSRSRQGAKMPSSPGGSNHSAPIIINSYNIHRLLIAGVMVAVKFLSDIFFTNVHISRVGGLPVQELNALEIEFLLLHEFNLNVSVEELQACGDMLLTQNQSMQTVHEALRERLLLTTPDGRDSYDKRSRSSTISVGATSPEAIASPQRRSRAQSELVGVSPSPGSIGPSALSGSGSASMISPLRRDHVGGKSVEDRYGYEGSQSYKNGHLATTPQSLATQSPSPAAEPHYNHSAFSPNQPVSSNGHTAPFTPSAPIIVKPTPRWQQATQPVSFASDGQFVRQPYSHSQQQQQQQQHPDHPQQQATHHYYPYQRSNSALSHRTDPSPSPTDAPNPHSRSSLQPVPLMYRQHTLHLPVPTPSPMSMDPSPPVNAIPPSIANHRSNSFPTSFGGSRPRAHSHVIHRPKPDMMSPSPSPDDGRQSLTPQSNRISHRLHRVSVEQRAAPEIRYANVFDTGLWGPRGGNGEMLDAYGRRAGGLVTCRDA
ncbi:hypothetical protein HDV00_001514 [Rhizophlyctis rosea]|nr:hypothetical protein HDV00_001514 [Rhizophlyctis rosea]